MSLFLLLGGTSNAFSAPVYGDLNGDTGVNVIDVQCAILTSLAELTADVAPACLHELAKPDVNCDDTVTVVDVLVVIGLALGEPQNEAIDADGDNVHDACDNCPGEPNPGNVDTDGDGLGDRCDEDSDGDEVPNTDDNCDLIANPDQLDTDADDKGDVCDDDDDNDWVLDGDDNCPLWANPDQTDTDADGEGDLCDSDDDGDEVPDADDNCPLNVNPDQADISDNGIGDACDCDAEVDCDDGNPCTLDLCTDSGCAYEAIDGCCLETADCVDPNECTLGSCTDNSCSFEPDPEACGPTTWGSIAPCDGICIKVNQNTGAGACGKCFTFCLWECDGKACGDNGCGGTCGTCGPDESCSEAFSCEPEIPAVTTFSGPNGAHSVFASTCGPCHTTGNSGGHSIGHSDLALAYSFLFQSALNTSACGDTTTVGHCSLIRMSDGSMPLSGSLSADQLAIIQAWVDGGMLFE